MTALELVVTSVQSLVEMFGPIKALTLPHDIYLEFVDDLKVCRYYPLLESKRYTISGVAIWSDGCQ